MILVIALPNKKSPPQRGQYKTPKAGSSTVRLRSSHCLLNQRERDRRRNTRTIWTPPVCVLCRHDATRVRLAAVVRCDERPHAGAARPFPPTAKPVPLNDWYHSKQSQTANSVPRDTHCPTIPVIAHEETS